MVLTRAFFILLIVLANSGLHSENPDPGRFAARTNYCPQWSSDGSKIIFYSQIGKNWQIVSMQSDGSGMKLLSSPGKNDFYPSWSPDQKRILFYSNRSGNHDIYTMSSDGRDVVQLTKDPTKDQNPRWSPDGQKIAFVAEREDEVEILRVMKSDGTGLMSITNPDEISVVSRVSWSPDGSRIVFYASNDRRPMGGSNRWAFHAVPSAGGKVERLGDWRRDANPDWSGPASAIVFDGHKSGSWESDDGGWEIFVMKPDGSNRKNLTNNERRNEWAPFWSPDGKKIAYCSGIDDRYEIHVMDADGKNAKRLTFNVWNGPIGTAHAN